MKKGLFKSLIALTQSELPFRRVERDVELPIDSGSIITVPGVRRAGKSSCLMIVVNRLLDKGIAKENILWINFDDERLIDATTQDLDDVLVAYREMFPDISLHDVYMFFDEIQNIPGWDLFVLRVFKSYCKNVFVTGSNAKLLSSEIATQLRGWTLDFEVLPLSLNEYCRFVGVPVNSYKETDIARLNVATEQYMYGGGFPEVVLETDKSMKIRRLQGYFNTMLFRDLVERHKIRNVEALRYFLKRIMNNLTKPTSVNNIYNDIRSQGLSISKDDLYDWADWATESYLFIRIPKYSMSLVKENQSYKKYYVIDNGLRQAVLLQQSSDSGKLLENAVALDLYRHRKPMERIYYWLDKTECDFVIQQDEKIIQLIQVSYSLSDVSTKEREIAGIVGVAKATGCNDLTIVTFDESGEIENNGYKIKIVKLKDWLLNRAIF